MKFYVGLHQPSDAKRFRRAFISVNRLSGPYGRKAPLNCPEWIMDSGAFTEISTYGHYRTSVDDYAASVRNWSAPGSGLIAAVAQDYMCEPMILEKTGLSIAEHQRLTIERYDHLLPQVLCRVIPVLQGYAPADYAAHIDQYGDRLYPRMWVGVGSVCKRNSTDPAAVLAVLTTVKQKRPDLRLHAFGLKTTALTHARIKGLLESADSMAWSFAARREGRNRNSWEEAKAYADRIELLINPA